MTEKIEINGLSVSEDEKEQDRNSIKQLVADAEKFQNDPNEYTQLHTEDTIIINVAGRRITGREKFHQVMKEAVNTTLVDVPTKMDVKNITFIRPDVAVVSCIKHIFDNRDMSNEDRFEKDSKANLTFMMVKEQEQWLIASAQSTLIRE